MEDQYALCEAGVLTSVRSLATAFPESWQVTTDGSKFTKGALNFFILRPGTFPVFKAQQKSTYDFQWNMTGELYVRFMEYAKAIDEFKSIRWAVIERLKSDPTLGGTKGVWEVDITSGGDVQFWYETETAPIPNFVVQSFSIVVTQRVIFEKRW
jgi:hypothetical protein